MNLKSHPSDDHIIPTGNVYEEPIEILKQYWIIIYFLTIQKPYVCTVEKQTVDLLYSGSALK